MFFFEKKIVIEQVKLGGEKNIVLDVCRSEDHLIFQDELSVNLSKNRPESSHLDMLLTGFGFYVGKDGGLHARISVEERLLPEPYTLFKAPPAFSNISVPVSTQTKFTLPYGFYEGVNGDHRDLRRLQKLYREACMQDCRHIDGQLEPVTCSREEGDPSFYPRKDSNITIRRPLRKLTYLDGLTASQMADIPHAVGIDLGNRNPLAGTDTTGNQVTIGHSSGHQIRNHLKRESRAQSERDKLVEQDPAVLRAAAALKEAEDVYKNAFFQANSASVKTAELSRAAAERNLSIATKMAYRSDGVKVACQEMVRQREKLRSINRKNTHSAKRYLLHAVAIVPKLDPKSFSSESICCCVFCCFVAVVFFVLFCCCVLGSFCSCPCFDFDVVASFCFCFSCYSFVLLHFFYIFNMKFIIIIRR